METGNDDRSTSQPNRPSPIDWGTMAIRAWIVVVVAAGVVLLIKLVRRGGGGVALAVAAPVIAAASTRRRSKESPTTRPEIDQEFLKTWLARIGIKEPVMTPAELCAVLNTLFEKDGREAPFVSPLHLANELKKLGLRSSVRSVAGRSERRWYDLSGYGTYEPPAQ